MARRKRSSKKRISRKTHKNQKDHHIPYLPLMIAFLSALVLSLLIFSDMPTTPTGYVVVEGSEDKVYCVKEGRDGLSYKVTDKKECCYSVENTDHCRGPVDNAYVDYYGTSEEVEGVFKYRYACFGGSSQRVLFGNIVRNYCYVNV